MWEYKYNFLCSPNLRDNQNNQMNPCAGKEKAKIEPDELDGLLTTRIKRIFLVAAEKNEVLILGAFGCGAFKNPPEIVARAFKKVMQDYLHCFYYIEFAVYHIECEIANYEAFLKILG